MPRPLPQTKTLEQAVPQVIDSNKADGFQPNHFKAMTNGKEGNELRVVCENLILSDHALNSLERAFRRYAAPLLTIEDYVALFGES